MRERQCNSEEGEIITRKTKSELRGKTTRIFPIITKNHFWEAVGVAGKVGRKEQKKYHDLGKKRSKLNC